MAAGVVPPNVPSPDPSLATNERLAIAMKQIQEEMKGLRGETKGWVDALQVLEERELSGLKHLLTEKIDGGIKNIGTRLDGNDTALVAALKAQKEEAAKQTENFKEVLGEIKTGIAKQFDSQIGQINDLKERMSESGGSSQGMRAVVTMVISGLAAFAAIGALVISLSKSASSASSPPHPGSISSPWPHAKL